MAFKMNPKSPLLKKTLNFPSPAQKALKGDQHKLPDHLKAKIEAAPGKKESASQERKNLNKYMPIDDIAGSPAKIGPKNIGPESPAKILGAVAGALGKAVVGKVVDKTISKKKSSPAKSFKGLVSKLEKQGKSKEAATKIAGKVANAKMKGAGSGPTAKQKARENKSRGGGLGSQKKID